MKVKELLILSAVSFFIASCGGGNGGSKSFVDSNSNIPYLKQNHDKYKEYGSTLSPVPKKDESKLSIDWIIEAQSIDAAKKLAQHIKYMESKLKANQNPRAFDKLFLMEAYMKYHKEYETSIEQNGKIVTVSKVAKNRCAYRVISAHSDAVSKDFFAKGDISKDYSNIAEDILKSQDCSSQKSDIENYIKERQKGRRI